VELPRSPLIPVHPIPAQPARVSTVPCTRCGSSDTEFLWRMRRNAFGSDDWVRCNECGHAFTTLPSWPP
jgi:hypothetical protein